MNELKVIYIWSVPAYNPPPLHPAVQAQSSLAHKIMPLMLLCYYALMLLQAIQKRLTYVKVGSDFDKSDQVVPVEGG